MTSKEYNQCRYCEHYKAYAVHNHTGYCIYACELELSRNPCIFKYVETPIESRLQKDNIVNDFIAYANSAFDIKLIIAPSEVSSDSFESLFGKIFDDM
jgi:hypothetical protein